MLVISCSLAAGETMKLFIIIIEAAMFTLDSPNDPASQPIPEAIETWVAGHWVSRPPIAKSCG